MTGEQAKAAAEVIATVWEGEHQATCQVIAAVGTGNRDYKPDPKSRSAWDVAVHIATADIWFLDSIFKGNFVWDDAAAKNAAAQFKTADDLLAFYKKTFPEKLNALTSMAGDQLAEPVDFFGMFKWPRAQFLGFANNHSVHHRGQLAAYLRAMGSKVPNIYGPSADAEPQR